MRDNPAGDGHEAVRGAIDEAEGHGDTCGGTKSERYNERYRQKNYGNEAEEERIQASTEEKFDETRADLSRPDQCTGEYGIMLGYAEATEKRNEMHRHGVGDEAMPGKHEGKQNEGGFFGDCRRAMRGYLRRWCFGCRTLLR